MLDETLVEAAQTIRALEDGDEEDFYPIKPSAPSPPPSTLAIESSTKRSRNGNDDGEREGERKRIATGGGAGGGLLSEDAMENLRYYADMAKRQAEESRATKKSVVVPKKQATGMALLGGYGSGDDSD